MRRLLAVFGAVAIVGCSLAIDVDRFNSGGPGQPDDARTEADSAIATDDGAVDSTPPADTSDVAMDTSKRRPQVFVAGGNVAGTNVTSVLRAEITEVGEVTAWADFGNLPASSTGTQATKSGSHVFILGPDFVTTNAATVRFASFDGAANLSSWSGQKTLIPRTRVAAASSDKYVYAIGGVAEGAPEATADVYVAPIGDGGTPGVFTAARSLPITRAGGCAVVVGDSVYVFGGYTGTNMDLQTVLRAQINTDGSLGEWTTQTNTNQAASGCSAVAFGKRVYVLGGYGAQDQVQHTLIGSTGDLGAWITGARMLSDHAFFQAAVAGGYVVVAGGFTGPTGSSDKVEIATISESGIGTWKSTTPLPKPRIFVNAFGAD